jgi:hypothetical protein
VSACLAPETLADYWLDDLPADEADAVEEHLLGCAACSAHLEDLVRLRDGVRALVRSGSLPVVVGRSFLDAAAREGLRVREYAVGPGERVACTVTPEDDLLVTRLRGDLLGAERVHLLSQVEQGPVQRVEDLPVDPTAGEVIVTQSMPALRALPTLTARMRLVAVDASGRERVVGDYVFDHSAHRS